MANNQSTPDINKYHRIILSMYYYSNRYEPGKCHSPESSIDIDMAELLLMMEGVFGTVHYKMCTDSKKTMTGVYVADEKEELYKGKISENSYLRDYGVLKVVKSDHYEDEEYQDITDVGKSIEAPANLYFHNLLISHINGTSKVRERNVLMHYLLFNNRNEEDGRMFIFYLKSRLVELVRRISDADTYGDPQLLAQSMDADHKMLVKLFDQKDRKIEDLKRRTALIRRKLYEADKGTCSFEHEAIVTDDWINVHAEKEIKTFSEFIFMRAEGYNRIALALIDQIVSIYKAVMANGTGNLRPWNEDISECKTSFKLLEMEKVSSKLNDLVVRAGSSDFKYAVWGEAYLKELDKAFKALGFDEI